MQIKNLNKKLAALVFLLNPCFSFDQDVQTEEPVVFLTSEMVSELEDECRSYNKLRQEGSVVTQDVFLELISIFPKIEDTLSFMGIDFSVLRDDLTQANRKISRVQSRIDAAVNVNLIIPTFYEHELDSKLQSCYIDAIFMHYLNAMTDNSHLFFRGSQPFLEVELLIGTLYAECLQDTFAIISKDAKIHVLGELIQVDCDKTIAIFRTIQNTICQISSECTNLRREFELKYGFDYNQMLLLNFPDQSFKISKLQDGGRIFR